MIFEHLVECAADRFSPELGQNLHGDEFAIACILAGATSPLESGKTDNHARAFRNQGQDGGS